MPLSRSYPIPEPINDEFIDRVGETIKAKLEKIADNATSNYRIVTVS